ncbi:hypothetical protein C8F01DRAFT_433441 [Mycena amicta]|nr:hypothetical protein C8F01DRAFT_433441 [Mycena amicta]
MRHDSRLDPGKGLENGWPWIQVVVDGSSTVHGLQSRASVTGRKETVQSKPSTVTSPLSFSPSLGAGHSPEVGAGAMFFFILTFSLWFLSGWAALVNVTIDDTTGDALTRALITYTPIDAWDACPNSPACVTIPDETRLVAGTWHESTFSVASSNKHPNVPSTATAAFNGSAVYVFCAIPRSTFDPNGNVQLTFYLDGIQAGEFSRSAVPSAGFELVPVFSLVNISAGPHTLTIQNGVQNGADSLMMLDSIVYTIDDGEANASSASSSSRGISSATVAVVSVLVFGVLLLLGILAGLLIRRRRKRRAVYAQYMPKGAVHAFPSFLEPSPASSPRMSPASSPPLRVLTRSFHAAAYLQWDPRLPTGGLGVTRRRETGQGAIARTRTWIHRQEASNVRKVGSVNPRSDIPASTGPCRVLIAPNNNLWRLKKEWIVVKTGGIDSVLSLSLLRTSPTHGGSGKRIRSS